MLLSSYYYESEESIEIITHKVTLGLHFRDMTFKTQGKATLSFQKLKNEYRFGKTKCLFAQQMARLTKRQVSRGNEWRG